MHPRHGQTQHDNSHTRYVDLGNAAIYVSGIQAIAAVLSSSVASVATCWLFPERVASSTRTLALSTLAGVMCVCVKGPRTAHRPCVVWSSGRVVDPLSSPCL